MPGLASFRGIGGPDDLQVARLAVGAREGLERGGGLGLIRLPWTAYLPPPERARWARRARVSSARS